MLESGAYIPIHQIRPLRPFDECDEDLVRKFQRAYEDGRFENGIAIPLPILFSDGGDECHVGDGHLRIAAQIRHGMTHICCDVILGRRRDAELYSIEVNGDQRSRAVKTAAVDDTLADPELAKLSDTEIAKPTASTVGSSKRDGQRALRRRPATHRLPSRYPPSSSLAR